MTTHHFTPDHYHVTMGSHAPVLHISDGDAVITTTVDAMGHDASNQSVTPGGNPQTGPFYVDGAEPGDTLALHLVRLVPNRTYGMSSAVLSPNVVDPHYARELPEWSGAEWHVDAAQGKTTSLVHGGISSTVGGLWRHRLRLLRHTQCRDRRHSDEDRHCGRNHHNLRAKVFRHPLPGRGRACAADLHLRQDDPVCG